MLVSTAGVALFLSEKVGIGWNAAGLGDLISLGASACFAAYNVANKPLLARYPVTAVMTWTLTLGAPPALLLALPSLWTQSWGRVSPAGWALLAWSIVVPVYLAWSIWAWVIARAGVARASPFLYLAPIAGGVTAWLLLDESFGALKLGGALLTLTGLALARHSAAR